MSDWIKLHRILLEWEWFTTPNMVHFWVYCLMRASYKEHSYRGIPLKEGQFIDSRKTMAFRTGLSEQQVRTCIERLKSTNELTSQSTNEYTVFTINSWKKYQIEDQSNQPPNQRATNEQPTSNQRATTYNKDNNGNNGKNGKKIQNTRAFIPPTIQEVRELARVSGYKYFDCEKYLTLRTRTEWTKANGKKVKNWKNDLHTSATYDSFQRKLTQEELDDIAMEEFARQCASNVNAGPV